MLVWNYEIDPGKSRKIVYRSKQPSCQWNVFVRFSTKLLLTLLLWIPKEGVFSRGFISSQYDLIISVFIEHQDISHKIPSVPALS